ncbi:restriction endonuclease subunit S [Agathobacter rectalis]|uniref:Restriction endonuclease subunit S n=1 Tax=Agathobacter rectalis TaxID=39491 RepID=A0A414ZHU8_9FIRM|nr:restriction endonuclease subunit S [Agathobacter rectalis]RHI17384.1 restriction endonuclease subunit S [Agathobacter rectalis]
MENPKIRFKGFTKDWEQRKLGEIATETYGGGTPKTSNEEFWKGDIPWIQSSDLIDECLFDVRPRKCISQEAVSKSATKLVPQNSIAIVTRVGVGKLAFMPFSYATSQDFLSLSGLKIDPEFTVYALYKMMQSVSNEVQGTSIKGVTKDELLAKKIIFPSCNEQKKIGAYLHSLDNLITLHQRKCEQTKKLKKYMLQKMFPQNGAKVPEIRFDGFTYDWEQRKLGDMGSTYTGLSGKTKEDFGHGDAKFITYMNVFSNPVANLDMTESVEIDSKQNCVKAGDVFFTTSSETPEEVGMSSVMPENADNIYLNSFCFGYRPTEKFDLNYLAYVLRTESFRKEMTFLAQGISRYNISKNKVMEVEIPIPSLDEQSRVGQYFKNLDTLITLHQRKCDELKKMKKYMLQNMFI